MESTRTLDVSPIPLAARHRLALCGLIAPLAFALGIVLAASHYPGYSHVTQAISELGGVDAPLPLTQTLNFFTAGLLTLAFAIGIGQHKRLRAGAALFGVLGAVMCAHGLLPCDIGCEFVTPVGTAHNLLGLVGFLAAIAGCGWWDGGPVARMASTRP